MKWVTFVVLGNEIRNDPNGLDGKMHKHEAINHGPISKKDGDH